MAGEPPTFLTVQVTVSDWPGCPAVSDDVTGEVARSGGGGADRLIGALLCSVVRSDSFTTAPASATTTR